MRESPMSSATGVWLGDRVSRRMALKAGSIAGLSMTGWAPGHAAAGTRVALVIGNARYAAAPLQNAANDARAVGKLLAEMGFIVVELRDATLVQMQQAIEKARAELHGRNGVGLLYFAGHGLQLDWRNYLLPIDAAPERASDVPGQAVEVQSVIDAFRIAGNRMNIVVLDACRDNPFGASGSGKGLAPLDAPAGTFLAYATAPGNVAEDGTAEEGNGLYTRFLIRELRRPDAKIEEVFKRVRLHVRQASRGRQVPWESTSLEDDFIFATGQAAERESGRQRDVAFEAEKADWDRIKGSRRAEDFYAFLQKYPNGMMAELAQFRLDQVSAAAVRPPPRRDGIAALPSGVNRFKAGDFFQYEALDHLSGATRRFWLSATSVSDDRVEMNNGSIVFDQMGGLLSDRFGRKDPALVQTPTELAVGKRWRSAFRNHLPDGSGWEQCYADLHVTSLETIEVHAGRFQAYRIEQKGESIGHRWRTLWTGTIWVDPVTMTVVRQEDRQRDPRFEPPTFHQTRQLVRMTRAPRP